jgi:hypothetical protein
MIIIGQLIKPATETLRTQRFDLRFSLATIFLCSLSSQGLCGFE